MQGQPAGRQGQGYGKRPNAQQIPSVTPSRSDYSRKRGAQAYANQAPAKGKKPRRKGSRFSKFLSAVGILLILVALVTGGIIAYQYLSARSAYSSMAKTADVDESVVDASVLQVDWDALRAINPNVVGWVLIPGTNVSYPITQTTDNNYYLSHLFDGSYSKAGAVFLDCDARPDFSCMNNLIYGHNLIDGSMFASVTKYTDPDFFNDHEEVLLATPERNYRLRVVCSLVWDGADGSLRQANFESGDDFHSFVQSLMNRAVVMGQFKASEVDQLFCLVTCSYQTDNARTVVCLTPVKTYDPHTGLEYREEKPETAEDAEAAEASESLSDETAEE